MLGLGEVLAFVARFVGLGRVKSTQAEACATVGAIGVLGLGVVLAFVARFVGWEKVKSIDRFKVKVKSKVKGKVKFKVKSTQAEACATGGVLGLGEVLALVARFVGWAKVKSIDRFKDKGKVKVKGTQAEVE
jgi:hypothetical protein